MLKLSWASIDKKTVVENYFLGGKWENERRRQYADVEKQGQIQKTLKLTETKINDGKEKNLESEEGSLEKTTVCVHQSEIRAGDGANDGARRDTAALCPQGFCRVRVISKCA